MGFFGARTAMALGAPAYERMLAEFRAGSGLFILGAGASGGITPFGLSFMAEPGLDFVFNSGSFSVTPPKHSELNRRIIRTASPRLIEGVRFEGSMRAGGLDYPYQELLQRLPGYFAYLSMKHALALPRFRRRVADNYSVFRRFAPSLLLTYNLDGLALDQCGDQHRIVDAHGTVPHGYGSGEVAKLVAAIREDDIDIPQGDDILLCVPESYSDARLRKALSLVHRCSPDFIAIIGYSFGRNGGSFDDHISLHRLGRRFRGFRGHVYIIDPYPDSMRDMVAECIGSNNVFGVPQFWNVLAHAFRALLTDQSGERSLNYNCERTLDLFGSGVAFPRDHVRWDSN